MGHEELRIKEAMHILMTPTDQCLNRDELRIGVTRLLTTMMKQMGGGACYTLESPPRHRYALGKALKMTRAYSCTVGKGCYFKVGLHEPLIVLFSSQLRIPFGLISKSYDIE